MKKNERMLDAISGIPEEYIYEASPENHDRNITVQRKRKLSAGLAAAACIALILGTQYKLLIAPVAEKIFSSGTALPSETEIYSMSGQNAHEIRKQLMTEMTDGCFPFSDSSVRYNLTVNIKDPETNNYRIWSGSISGPSELCTFSDACANDEYMWYIGNKLMIFSDHSETTMSERYSFSEGSRILGIDSEKNVYILDINRYIYSEKQYMIRKINTDFELLAEYPYFSDYIPVNEICGFDDMTVSDDKRTVTVTYRNHDDDSSIVISPDENDSFIIKVNENEKEQIIRTNENGVPDTDGDNIFSYDKINGLLTAHNRKQILDTDTSRYEAEQEMQHAVWNTFTESGTFFDKDLQYSYGSAKGEINISVKPEAAVKLSVYGRNNNIKDTDIIRNIPADTDVINAGGTGETGYLIASSRKNHEFSVYSFDRTSPDTVNNICNASYDICDIPENTVSYGMCDGLFYKDYFYILAGFLDNNDKIELKIFRCDKEGNTECVTLPEISVASEISPSIIVYENSIYISVMSQEEYRIYSPDFEDYGTGNYTVSDIPDHLRTDSVLFRANTYDMSLLYVKNNILYSYKDGTSDKIFRVSDEWSNPMSILKLSDNRYLFITDEEFAVLTE